MADAGSFDALCRAAKAHDQKATILVDEEALSGSAYAVEVHGADGKLVRGVGATLQEAIALTLEKLRPKTKAN